MKKKDRLKIHLPIVGHDFHARSLFYHRVFWDRCKARRSDFPMVMFVFQVPSKTICSPCMNFVSCDFPGR